MATTASYVPLEVYLHSSSEPDAEYVNGEIQERAVGELDHAAWQSAIQRWFWLREQEWGIRVFAELRVQVAPARFRVPDVVVLENTGPLKEMEQIVRTPPVAIFEILSPEDTFARLLQKLNDYESMGVPSIFVINPKNDEKFQYVAGDLKQVNTVGISVKHNRHTFNLNEIEEFLK